MIGYFVLLILVFLRGIPYGEGIDKGHCKSHKSVDTCLRDGCQYNFQNKACLSIKLEPHTQMLTAAVSCVSFTTEKECTAAGCYYNISENICKALSHDCLGITGCRRGNAFYIHGGQLTHNTIKHDRGLCKTKRPPLAINLAGGIATDSRGILHDEDRNSRDPYHTKMTEALGGYAKCPNGVNIKDGSGFGAGMLIYGYQIKGKTEKHKPGRCVTYPAKMTKAGRFELCIRTVEASYGDEFKQRHFNIRFMNMTIVSELNIRKHVGVCDPMELILEFEVKAGILMASGFPPQEIKHGIADLEFCYGEKEANDLYDPNYVVSAFYIAQMKVPKSNQIVESLTGCRRAGAHYSEGGAIFFNNALKDMGFCEIKQMVLAFSFGLMSEYQYPVDSRKYNGILIPYSREFHDKIPFDDPHNTRTWVNNYRCTEYVSNSLGYPTYPDIFLDNLYTGQRIGKDETRGAGRCLSYPVQITQNGVYEICIKTMETEKDDDYMKRHFNIRLNDIVVVPEFHIREYVEACEKMEIIIEFEVNRGVLNVVGAPTQMVRNGKIDLKFCYGDHEANVTYDPNYLVSAFYVARLEGPNANTDFCPTEILGPTEPPIINLSTTTEIILMTTTTAAPANITPPLTNSSEYLPEQNCNLPGQNANPTACISAGCIYDSTSCTCQPQYNPCKLSPGISGCLRAKTFYNQAGRICFNIENEDIGNCHLDSTIIAVNTGCFCKGCNHIGNRGIHYQSDSYHLFSDPFDTRYDVNLNDSSDTNFTMCIGNIGSVSSKDKPLYYSYAFGKPEKAGKGRCVYYPIQLTGDGRYELSIKTVAQRFHFNVLLNNMMVLPELNVTRYINDCQGMELITEFSVDQNILTMSGMIGQRLSNDGKVTLAFCYGDGNLTYEYNPSYIVSAFYVTKMQGGLTCTAPSECNKYSGGHVIGCRMAGCEYNLVTDVCVVGPLDCDYKKAITRCQRANAIYISGGVSCYSKTKTDQGNCSFQSVTHAVNFGGGTGLDSRGIVYADWNLPTLFTDANGMRTQENSGNSLCRESVIVEPALDKPLYLSQMGSAGGDGPGGCIIYHSQIKASGKYELSIKTQESNPWINHYRYFNIRINNIVVVPEFNIRNYVNECTGIELIIEFQVSNQTLLISGFPEKLMAIDKKIDVGFCNGDGKANPDYNPNLLVSAFYIAALQEFENLECHSYKNKIFECKSAGCEFDLSTEDCRTGPKACKDIDSITGCRRGGSFYSTGGVMCSPNTNDDHGTCIIKNVVLAVNFGGGTGKDSRGIYYEDWNSPTSYTDEHGIRSVTSSETTLCEDNVIVFPEMDKPLYLSQMLGSFLEQQDGRCVVYHANVTTNGKYELCIKTAETMPYDGALRYFNIRINGKVVVAELNIQKYVRGCKGIEFVLEFEVKSGQLAVAGFPETPIANNGQFDVGFCYGEMKTSTKYIPNFLVSAFYIAQIDDTL